MESMHPPTEQGPVEMVPDAPAWPKVVGVISIVWASLSLTCGGLGVAWMLAMPWVMGMAADRMGPVPDVLKPEPMMIILGGIGLIWNVALLTAGIMTVRRTEGGRPMHLAWAAGAIVLSAIGLYLQWQWQERIQEWAAQNPGNEWAKQQSAGGEIGQLIGLVLGIVIGFGWPLFCLAWFGLTRAGRGSMTVRAA